METRNKTILQIVIYSIAFLIFINIWPLNNLKLHDYSKVKCERLMLQSQTKNDRVIQHVIFEKNHLENITVYVNVSQYNEFDSVTFRMYDENFKPVYYSYARCELIERDGKVTFNTDLDVEPGKNYFYEWIVPEERINREPIIIEIPLVQKEQCGQIEPVASYINENGSVSLAIRSDFDYSKDVPAWGIVLSLIGLALSSQIIYQLMVRVIYSQSREKNRHADSRSLKILLTVFATVVLIVGLIFSVCINVFGGFKDDRIVYTIGILTVEAWVIYALWFNKDKKENLEVNSITIWKNYLQVICFAMAIYSACRYVNALQEATHVENTRRIITYLLCAYVFIIDKKNRPDYKIWKNVNMPMLIIWGIMMILILINNSGYSWPPVILVFAIPLLFKMDKNGWNRLLDNFTLGIYVSFLITTVFSLLYRPYNAWIYYRYPGMFHTVAYTGMYLCLVISASIARYFSKKRLLDLFVFATSVGFVLLSMTRAAILSSFMASVFAIILSIVAYKNKISTIIKQLMIMGGVTLATFFMVFSLTRIVPALVNEPYIMSIEGTEEFGVCKGEKLNSSRYMSFNRYISIMLGRFGAGSGTSITTSQISDLISEGDLLANANPYMLPASVVIDTSDANTSDDASNGRMEIFRAYIRSITLEPHDTFSTVVDGKEYAHAHNAYLQVSYLFGLVTGIVFVVYCIVVFASSLLYFLKNKEELNGMVPLLLVTVFGVTSLIEWTFQPGIPMGLVFMFIGIFLSKRTVEDKANK